MQQNCQVIFPKMHQQDSGGGDSHIFKQCWLFSWLSSLVFNMWRKLFVINVKVKCKCKRFVTANSL